MGFELLLLVFVGVALIYTVEDWAFADSVYWAVQTLFTIGFVLIIPIFYHLFLCLSLYGLPSSLSHSLSLSKLFPSVEPDDSV